MGETITMKAETGVIEVTGGAQGLQASDRPLRQRVFDVLDDMFIRHGALDGTHDYTPFADRILDLIEAERQAERERCAGIVVNDEHTMAHVKARLSNKIRGDA